ncbi:hypothetical protein BBP00_00003026 [Phytophthora kernoviae]|uniref:Fe2OG dioxygenase domain-containing protein n=1 Tax=Phytophthora kernoviae TaxID=325452 RepID=A0A3F2RX56_9STRA|nr:hypothetical protein BBP00_00003026 [Phytophthora kernoviae]
MAALLRWVTTGDDDDDDGDANWLPEYEGESIVFEDSDGTPILSDDERAHLDKVFDGEPYAPLSFRRSEHEKKQREMVPLERIAHQLRGYNKDPVGVSSLTRKQRLFHTLCHREQVGTSSKAQLIKLQETFMPFQENKHCRVVDAVRDRLYCGGFNSTGSRFLTAGQRGEVLLYDTVNWDREAYLPVRDISWTVTDAKFTPDDANVMYSTINSNVRMVSTNFEEDGKEHVFPLARATRGQRDDSHIRRMNRFGRFGVWCIDINAAGTEFVAGTSQSSVILMDMQTQVPVCHVIGHHDDVNAIAFVDGPLHSNVFVSGSDDSLIKLWDRRVLSESNPKPQGVFPGHADGISHISSRDDGYYFISNSKDQTTKLWDIRKCFSSDDYDDLMPFRKPYSWDYRYQAYPGRNKRPVEHPDDTSVMTYRGHMVIETLIRCYFSPLHSTAQKYIYTGSADGRVYVYDSITGDLVEIFAMKHNGITRDVRWHPFEPTIVSPDFYGKLCVWQRQDEDEQPTNKLHELLHEKPCELIGKRALYVEFALPRKEQEARDRLLRVHNVSRTADPPGLRVPGLRFEAEFITKEQEAACVAFFDRDDGASWANTIRARQVQHFGYEFNYDTRRCDPNEPMKDPIPDVLQPIVEQIKNCGVMDGDMPDQITINEYLPGQGIAYHLDTHSAFTTTIASLSICSEVVMDFRHPDGVRHEGVLLPARSLVVMSGESRYKWEHSICPRTFDVIDRKQVNRQRRLSITFRKIRSGPCECPFLAYCDTPGRQEQEDTSTNDQVAGNASLAPTVLEQQYVHEFYETVAAHFSSTRHSPWPRVAQFVASLPGGSMIADLGCGNGKYMKCVDETQSFVVGGDRSSRLVGICRERGLEAMVCDALAVPLRSNLCDAALSIAVLHHLSTLGHRLAAVKELLRVLRVGGHGIIYAWAHEQMKGSRRRFEEGRQDFMVPWNLDKRFAFSAEDDSSAAGASDDDQGEDQPKDQQAAEDLSGDDKAATKVQERVVVQRYCHMFKQGELEELVALAGNAEVEESYYDESNWAVILRRVS